MVESAQPRQKAERPVAPAAAAGGLIDGVYAVDLNRKLPQAGGGLPAFVVQDRRRSRDSLMALQVRRTVAARAKPFAALVQQPVAGVACPLAHGTAPGPETVPSTFVVCQAPPGTPLGSGASIGRVWNEAELITCVLRPVAAALAELQALHVTHRSIRPDNLFQSAPGQRVTLGAAWAAPPASLQPAICEPPYVAMCARSGRGDGSAADDVYALGVLLLALATGTVPLAGMDESDIVRRKLTVGSYAAMVDERTVPPIVADLARGMLAEDPEHRPTPAQLLDPETARTRRVPVRPGRLAARPIEVGNQAVLSLRPLAAALAGAPNLALPLLHDGQIDRWLRRSLSDAGAAARIEEVLRLRDDAPADDGLADAMLLARTVVALDPLAPLCWRGLCLWPDGLGGVLAEAEGQAAADLRDAVNAEAVAGWAALRPDRGQLAMLRLEARQNRAILVRRGWVGGLPVLRYLLNPLLPCASKALGRAVVVRIQDLLPALEQEAARPDRAADGPIDAEMAAFIVARQDMRLERELAILSDPDAPEATEPGAAVLAQVQILARLQERTQAPPVPQLAALLGAALRPAFAVWRSRSRRQELEAKLDERIATGRLEALLDLLDNPPLRGQDEHEAADATGALARIDAVLATLLAQRDHRVEAVRRIGQEAAAALGVIAVSAVALWLAL